MADNDVPAEADEVSDDELEEADEESFPPATLLPVVGARREWTRP